MIERITGEIFLVAGSKLTSPEDAAAYLIAAGDQAALVDSGCGYALEEMLRNIQECGVALDKIAYLLLTHCHFDHSGGAKAFRDRTGCQIVAHEAEAKYLEAGNNEVTAASWYGSVLTPFAVDRIICGSQADIELGGRIIQAFHTPGHSPGSMVFLVESDGFKVLFGQDVHGPLDRQLLSSHSAYLKSLELMVNLEADILCEGHFGVFKGKERVARFIRRFM